MSGWTRVWMVKPDSAMKPTSCPPPGKSAAISLPLEVRRPDQPQEGPVQSLILLVLIKLQPPPSRDFLPELEIILKYPIEKDTHLHTVRHQGE